MVLPVSQPLGATRCDGNSRKMLGKCLENDGKMVGTMGKGWEKWEDDWKIVGKCWENEKMMGQWLEKWKHMLGKLCCSGGLIP